MSATLALIVGVIGGLGGLMAGLKHELSGTQLVLAVSGAVLGAVVLVYAVLLALKVVVIAGVIVGIYYAFRKIKKWWRS